MLKAFILRPSKTCLGVSAICEFGHSDPEITKLNDSAAKALRAALERRIAEGKAAGEIDGGIDAAAAAHFLLATLSASRSQPAAAPPAIPAGRHGDGPEEFDLETN